MPFPVTTTTNPVRSRLYWVLVLALIPLLLSMFQPNENTTERIKQAVDDSPDVVTERIHQAIQHDEVKTWNDVVAYLPGGKLEGALLPRKTWAHWGFAAASAVGAGLLVVLLFGADPKTLKELALVSLFTGTIGIALLLLVQVAADATQGAWVPRGGGKAAIFLLIIKFIGFSYRAALDPENGFGASFFGFTCGVGFCEELCKAAPLVWHFRNKATLDWRGALVWGLASGVGFGVSEGITYSSDFYNGLSGGQIYVVRFVSCVALHAFWAGAIAMVLHERQQTIQGEMNWYELVPPLLTILAVPMILHGLYDTMLKRAMDFPAFGVAVASFAWFVFQIEKRYRAETPRFS